MIIETKNKYVYEIHSLDKFFGMMPLDVYITLVYFNYSNEEHHNVLLSLGEIAQFVTEFLTEALTRERFDFSKLDITASDFYISAMPCYKDTRKFMLMKHGDKKILISEMKYFSDSGTPNETLKMKNISKDELLKLVLSVHQVSLTMIDEVIKKCSNAKKLSLVGVDETKDEIKEQEVNVKKYDLKDYEKIN